MVSIPEKCSDEQSLQFELALKSFRQCSSGLDLVKLVEELPSVAIGSAIECFHGFFDDTKDDKETVFDDQCRDYFFGKHAIGSFLRSVYLYPDTILPCFDELSKVPDCTYTTWPIPLVGPWLKTVSCVLGNTNSLVEDVCAIELSNIEECLAQDDGSGSDDLCQDGLDRCSEEADDNNGSMILSNDSPYHGAPLPDTCIRVANVSGKQKVVERYNEVRSQCFDLEGWSYGIQVDEKETHGDDRSNPNFDKSTLKIGVGCFFGGIVLGALVIGMLVTRRTQTPVVLPRREEDPKEQLEGFVNGLAA